MQPWHRDCCRPPSCKVSAVTAGTAHAGQYTPATRLTLVCRERSRAEASQPAAGDPTPLHQALWLTGHDDPDPDPDAHRGAPEVGCRALVRMDDGGTRVGTVVAIRAADVLSSTQFLEVHADAAPVVATDPEQPLGAPPQRGAHPRFFQCGTSYAAVEFVAADGSGGATFSTSLEWIPLYVPELHDHLRRVVRLPSSTRTTGSAARATSAGNADAAAALSEPAAHPHPPTPELLSPQHSHERHRTGASGVAAEEVGSGEVARRGAPIALNYSSVVPSPEGASGGTAPRKRERDAADRMVSPAKRCLVSELPSEAAHAGRHATTVEKCDGYGEEANGMDEASGAERGRGGFARDGLAWQAQTE